MVKKALSDNVKRHKQQRAHEFQLKEAAQAYTEGQQGYRVKKSYATVAHEFSVDETTLRRRVNKIGTPMAEFNATKQKLTPIGRWNNMRMPFSRAKRGQIMSWSKPLDTQRAKSLSPAALASWWKIFRSR
ncbi:hypothetical protein CPB83DRAFT_844253 [Crepidotus variabilis]|uniref:Uncharacterized protein n=1 Tax=Crepidotus variabilis TaxID=179855 RepID=A0A9P6JVF3_9AGAR|nr:hypothetical protein CPB83DRAFT_844253 [Crepidotus variabilis]